MKSPMEILKQWRSTLEVIVGILVALVYLNSFVSDRITSKQEFLTITNEILINQVEFRIEQYQRRGLDTLSDQDRHKYDLLLKQQEKLYETRNDLIGL